MLDDLRRSIALALGIPEDYIAMARGGSKETKDDHISTNPRYSKMLSMVQQSLSKGIVDFHLQAPYNKIYKFRRCLTQTVDKDKIEGIIQIFYKY